MVPPKYLSNFCRTLEKALIIYEINLIITWSAKWFRSRAAANQATTFSKTDAKLYALIVAYQLQMRIQMQN